MRKLWPLILLTLGLGAAALTAADFWQKKKFTEWTDKEVQKMLKDSPWARPVEVRTDVGGGGLSSGGGGRGRRGGGGGGGGGGGFAGPASGGGGFDNEGGARAGATMEGVQAPPTVTAIVRWHTALTIKQAIAKARYGNEAATSPDAAKMLGRQEQQYVVGVAGLPGRLVRGKPEQLRSSAFLRIKGQPPIQAADVKGDREQDRANLYLFFPKGQQGSHVITLEDQEVEVVLKLSSLEVKRKFRLKDMVYDGKLEI